MNKIAKGVVFGLLVILPVVFLGGCAKRCGRVCTEPRLKCMEQERCGK